MSKADIKFQHTHTGKKKTQNISGENSSQSNMFKNLQVDVLEKYFC